LARQGDDIQLFFYFQQCVGSRTDGTGWSPGEFVGGGDGVQDLATGP
jgi:hypothetical protein